MKKLNPLTRFLDRIQLAASKRLNKPITDMHAAIYNLTGGALGGRLRETKVLLLTTTGRKTGNQHTSPLNYLPYKGSYAVAASNSGRPNHPAWYLNLLANPEATVQLGRATKEVRARETTEEERSRLWTELVSKARNYGEYEKMTTRKIPMMILEQVEQPERK
ncbi:MAG: nitroreductase family deazaflavin-dependent oxidoreductase [Chloroflexia bacterium]